MLIGASTGALYPMVLTEDAVDTLAHLGFPLIEIMPQTSGEYRPEFARLIGARLRDSGTRAYSVHAFTGLHPVFDPYPRRRQEGIDRFHRAIEFAVEIEATCLIWHGLTRAELQAGANPGAFHAMLATFAHAAQIANVRLTIENVSWCWSSDVSAISTIEKWGLPVGFTFDPFQAQEAGVEHEGLIGAMRGALINVHASDFGPGAGGRHLPIGAGVIEWPRILRVLLALGYDGPIMLECSCEGDLERLARSREILNALLMEPH